MWQAGHRPARTGTVSALAGAARPRRRLPVNGGYGCQWLPASTGRQLRSRSASLTPTACWALPPARRAARARLIAGSRRPADCAAGTGTPDPSGIMRAGRREESGPGARLHVSDESEPGAGDGSARWMEPNEAGKAG